MCFRSKVNSTSGFHFRFRGRHLSFRCRTMSTVSYSDRAGSKIWSSRWNSFAICFRSKVISTSGFHFRICGRHLRFRCRPMSGRVGSVISMAGVVDNVGVAVEIASPYVSVQKLLPLPGSTSGFVANICIFGVGRCRAMSAVSNSGPAWSKMWG